MLTMVMMLVMKMFVNCDCGLYGSNKMMTEIAMAGGNYEEDNDDEFQ